MCLPETFDEFCKKPCDAWMCRRVFISPKRIEGGKSCGYITA